MEIANEIIAQGVVREKYSQFCVGIENMHVAIPLDGIKPVLANYIFKKILRDHPDFFWFDGKWALAETQNSAVACPRYLHSRESATATKQKINELSEMIVTQANELATSYQKATHIYNWILKNVCYGFGPHEGQTIDDALIERKAVCKGLSKAYQLLMMKCGISTTLREGTIDGRATHIWNGVILDKEILNVDISMGYSQFSYLFREEIIYDPYRCFWVTDETITKTHRLFS